MTAENSLSKADQFRDYTEHTGGPPPYQPADKVDVQFADGRVELDARASYWANRGGFKHGMWDHRYPNFSHHIVRHRLASNPFHRDGLERSASDQGEG